MVKRRKLTKNAIKNYNTVFNEINELFDVTPSDIVKIGKREQKPYLDKETGAHDILDLEDRTVTIYQFKYHDYLKSKGLADTTIKLKIDSFRALLGEFNIQKPKPIEIIIPKDRIRDEDIVFWREVEKALSFCKSIMDKAIVSFFCNNWIKE